MHTLGIANRMKVLHKHESKVPLNEHHRSGGPLRSRYRSDGACRYEEVTGGSTG